jgi:tRNA pseudouridine38-40 synthase
MARYFLEVAYKGSAYSGFQIQKNAISVQEKVEAAFSIFFRKQVELTGSSRTDAGVHARQNFFHFDWEGDFDSKYLYNLNSLLPPDITIRSLRPVQPTAHARFDAIARHYQYTIYREKNPFLDDRAWFLPFPCDMNLLHLCAEKIKLNTCFKGFSKANTQVKSFDCKIFYSQWTKKEDILLYEVSANRFLRGMVRGLVASMIRVGRGTIPVAAFEQMLMGDKTAMGDFSAPAKGLFLDRVDYPEALFLQDSF